MSRPESETGPRRLHGRRGGRGEGEEAKGGVERLELCEEEKAVLMECRRNSLARGVLLSAGSAVLLRMLIGTGRAPPHVQRWSSAYYTAVGAVAFLVGMRSYRHRCLEKIMALEHSALADQMRQHQRRQQDWTGEAEMLSGPLPVPSSTPSPPHPSPSRQPQSSERDTVPSDQHFTSAGQSGGGGEQPAAFASVSSSSGVVQDDYIATPTRTRGRTFDEIRDDNRRKQLQQYPQHSSGLRGEDSGKSVRVRRNKYGDIVSED